MQDEKGARRSRCAEAKEITRSGPGGYAPEALEHPCRGGLHRLDDLLYLTQQFSHWFDQRDLKSFERCRSRKRFFELAVMRLPGDERMIQKGTVSLPVIWMGLGSDKEAAWRVGKPALLFLGFGAHLDRSRRPECVV